MFYDEDTGKMLVEGNFTFDKYSEDGKLAVFADKAMRKYKNKDKKFTKAWIDIISEKILYSMFAIIYLIVLFWHFIR